MWHRRVSRRAWSALLFGAAFLVFVGLVKPAPAAEPLVLAVHPYLPSAELLKRFTPLADRLAVALDRPVNVVISSDYDVHIGHIGGGDVDIAFLGPAAYVALTGEYGRHRLLARMAVMGKPTFHGYVVTRQDSPVKTLADMKGRRFAFGDVKSTMSHMVPYAMLLDAGVGKGDLSGYDFLGSHKNVALAVLAGAFDAGGVKEEVYAAFKDKGLRMVAKSPPVSEHLFVASRRLSDADAGAVRKVLLSTANQPGGRDALMAIKASVDALVDVSDKDYAPLRAMIALTRSGS